MSKEEERRWIEELWVPPEPPPLRRTRTGFAAVRVGDAKKPGPSVLAGFLASWVLLLGAVSTFFCSGGIAPTVLLGLLSGMIIARFVIWLGGLLPRRPRWGGVMTGRRGLADTSRSRVGVRRSCLLILLCIVLGVHDAARPRKEVDRETPLGHDVEPKYEADTKAALADFDGWLENNGWLGGARVLAEGSIRNAGERMTEYIMDLSEDDVTRGEAELAILGFQRQFWWMKPACQPAWRLLKEWRLREPVELRSPASSMLVRAVMRTALSWDWPAFAICVWLGFSCLRRPGELCEMVKEDIRLQAHGSSSWTFRDVAVVIVKKPKARKVAARRQHVLLEERGLLRVLVVFLASLSAGEKLWPFTQATFANRLRVILEFLGCPDLFPPSGLRAGGATHHWLAFRNFGLLRLKGRWLSGRSLEHYVEECCTFLNECALTKSCRKKVELLAAMVSKFWKRWMKAEEVPREVLLLPVARRALRPACRGRAKEQGDARKRARSAPAV